MSKLAEYEFAYMNAAFALRESTKGFYHLECPSCKQRIGRSGAYNPQISRYYCFQGGCEYGKSSREKGTSIVELVRDFEGLPDFKAAVKYLYGLNPKTYTKRVRPSDFNSKTIKQIQRVKLPEGYINVMYGQTKVANDARAYLQGRGYDLKTCSERYKLGYIDSIAWRENSYYGYLVIPFHNRFGKLIYYQLRALYSYLQRWDNPSTEDLGLGKENIMFNESVIYSEKWCFMHEGATDGMTTHCPGTLGLVLSDSHVETIRRGSVQDVFFMYDEGVYFEALQNAYKATGSRKNVYVIPMHKGDGDPNDLGMEGCLRKREEAIKIDRFSYMEELDRIEWEMGSDGKGKKSFRGESSGIQVFF